MARYYGKTKERGYGADHQKLRLQLLARWQPGDPCARCGQPMMGPPARIHLGHTEDRTGYTGLEHSDCNCAEGAQRGNRQQPRSLVMLKAGNPVCQGCGQPYHYAARSCEMCSAHYHPSYGQQRTCSRMCGTALKRRTHGPSLRSKPPKPKPPCETCGRPCGELDHRFCSKTCSGAARSEARQTWPSSQLQHYTCRYCGTQVVAKRTGQLREVCPAPLCQVQRLNDNRQRNDGRHRPDWFGTSRAW
jgi:hypothetical protein